MAGMTSFQVDFDSHEMQAMFRKMRKLFPEIRASALGFVGHEAKKTLKKRYLSGQEIDLQQYPEDVLGRRTVSYSVGRNAKYVKISSYPMNLFERGRTLRSGKRESGKQVVTKKLKQAVMSNMGKLTKEFDRKYLQKEIDKKT